MKTLVAILMCLLGVVHVQAVTPQQIDSAIDKAKAYLYSKQSPDGTWERDSTYARVKPDGDDRGGFTALVTYSLLASGEKATEPRLAKALEYLRRLDSKSIYVIGIRAQIWAHLPNENLARQLATLEAKRILNLQKTTGDAKFMWHYPGTAPEMYDHSVSQYGVLGLWACEQVGAEIDTDTWVSLDRAWRAHQNPDGSWQYQFKKIHTKDAPTPSMTAAGLATLFIIQEFLYTSEAIKCRGNLNDPAINKGIEWLAAKYKDVYAKNPMAGESTMYTLYGIERVGLAGGYKLFGDNDWFESGVNYLIPKQGKDGGWGRDTDMVGANADRLVSTGFALLFLSRGHSPVVMNKLSYDVQPEKEGGKVTPGNWNQRPRDVANLVRWTGDRCERFLNWQVVKLSAPLRELQDAPTLFIAGNTPLKFTEEEEKKLRDYALEGGMIIFNADCGDKKFADSARKLGSRLFPQYEFRELPKDHRIYTGQQFPTGKFKQNISVLGISNGVRELAILITQADVARAWQLRPGASRIEPFSIGADLLQYSVAREFPRNRFATHLVDADTNAKARKTISITRLKYQGNWDPEPAGWKRLAAVMLNNHQVQLDIQIKKLGDSLDGISIAHMTGTGPLKLSDAERAGIKTFVEAGGLLIIDAAGGDSAFASDMQTELGTIFGEASNQLSKPLAEGHDLYRKPGKPLTDVQYRPTARRRLGALNVPQLRGMEIKGKLALIFSIEDLSTGLMGSNVDGVDGYAPDSAVELMRRLILSRN